MSADRNVVMAAVLALITSATFAQPVNGKNTWAAPPSLRLKLWNAVAADQQPAAFLVTHRETYDYTGLGLSRRRLELGVWCYSRTDDPETNGQTDLDTILQAIEAVLVPDSPSDNTLTLGGLVYWCRIQGRVFKDPGDIDSQTLLIVPLVIEMP